MTHGSRLSNAPARFPTPYPTACPIVLSWPAHGCNFDSARQSSSSVSTSVAGHRTVVQVNSSIYNIVTGQIVTLNGITMQTIEVRLSVCTVLMAFKLANVNTAATLADICVFTDRESDQMRVIIFRLLRVHRVSTGVASITA
jgi:hypothetical protein